VRLFDQTPQTLRRLARKAQLTSDQA
jgi:hypothetical protein